jgi:oxysterol-binding protein-related protein 3/6/7
MSTGTTSDESIQWFDADDGPEEYVIEEPEPAEAPMASDVESVDEEGYESPALSGAEESKLFKPPVRRRTHLPAPITGDEMSLLSVLRKNVGKVWLVTGIYTTSNIIYTGSITDSSTCRVQ